MVYIPKSQTSVKYAEPGKFETLENRQPYTGDYVETSGGIFYMGNSNLNMGDEIIPILDSETNKTQGRSDDVRKFNILKKDIKKFLSNTQSIPSMKRYPSESDYNKGFFKRYFSRRIKSTGYQEIDKDIYDSIQSKEEKYDHNLYEIGNIRWNLKGNVFKDNALALKALERKFRNISYLFPIFDEFAREPMQNQENLHTEGGELYYSDSTEYIGGYHIHMTKGPMVGAYHTEVKHDKLYYISELPTPPNMSYEDFLSNYPPPTITPIIPTRPPVGPLISNDVRGTPVATGESYDCVSSWGPAPPGYLGLTIATSEENPNGLVIVGSSCIDPGTGNGLYNINGTGQYGPVVGIGGDPFDGSILLSCQISCEGALYTSPNDTSTGNVGCLVPWDANYCSNCLIHDPNACASTYSLGGSSAGSGGGSYGGGGGGGTFLGNTCFTSKTSIIMEDETVKRIDEVKVGDIVKSEINTSNVIGIDIHKEKEHTIYSINNSEAFVTAEHPFKTTTGWKAIDPLETLKTHGIESNVLEIGDTLITKEGTEEVKSIEKSNKTTDTVYNLRLDNEHVYYANGYLVHNNKYGGMGMDDLEGLAETWNEEMGYDFGGFTAEQCPCGMFNGIMLYASCCCDESC